MLVNSIVSERITADPIEIQCEKDGVIEKLVTTATMFIFKWRFFGVTVFFAKVHFSGFEEAMTAAAE